MFSIGLEVRIGFGQCEQPPQGGWPSAPSDWPSSFNQGLCIRRIGLRRVEAGGGRVAGIDDGFKRLPLVLHIALDGFDKVRDQVVAPSQLHVDLGERRS